MNLLLLLGGSWRREYPMGGWRSSHGGCCFYASSAGFCGAGGDFLLCNYPINLSNFQIAVGN
eukprot:jgi/Botrbrau1/20890/Bobra.0135s0021.1